MTIEIVACQGFRDGLGVCIWWSQAGCPQTAFAFSNAISITYPSLISGQCRSYVLPSVLLILPFIGFDFYRLLLSFLARPNLTLIFI